MELPTPPDLKERRTELDLTQSELADRADVSQPLIARVEGGDVDPRLSTLRRIVEALEEAEGSIKRARDVMNGDVVTIRADDSVAHAVDVMGEHGFSQLPVLDETGDPQGIVTNSDIRHHRGDSAVEELPVAEVMSEAYGTVDPDTPLDEIDGLLDHYRALFVKDGGDLKGIITEADVTARIS